MIDFIIFSTNWLSIFEYAIKTVIVGGVVFLIGAIIRKWAEKSLHEHHVRFSKLHDDRAVVIKELYTRLVKMEKSVITFMNPFQYENALPTEQQQKIAAKDAWNFIMYHDENRIFFSSDVCNLIEEIYKTYRKAWIDFTVYAESNLPSIHSIDRKRQNEAFEVVKEKMPKLRERLEVEFRTLLGVKS